MSTTNKNKNNTIILSKKHKKSSSSYSSSPHSILQSKILSSMSIHNQNQTDIFSNHDQKKE